MLQCPLSELLLWVGAQLRCGSSDWGVSQAWWWSLWREDGCGELHCDVRSSCKQYPKRNQCHFLFLSLKGLFVLGLGCVNVFAVFLATKLRLLVTPHGHPTCSSAGFQLQVPHVLDDV
jgi:hypothetical protein